MADSGDVVATQIAAFTCAMTWVSAGYTVAVMIWRLAFHDADLTDTRIFKHIFLLAGLLNVAHTLRNNKSLMPGGSSDVIFGVLATASGVSAIYTYIRYIRGPEPDIVDMSNKVVIITGANTGIGFEAAKTLVRWGAHVVMACRSEEKGKAAMARILKELQAEMESLRPDMRTEVTGRMTFLPIDVGSLASVRAFADAFKKQGLPLDVLILNAGIMMQTRQESVDGHEMHLAVNHLGHFLLAELLLPQLDKATDPRVVIVSSSTHHSIKSLDFDDLETNKGYSMFKAYSRSKLANVMHTTELARRLAERKSKVLVNAVHPGLVVTEITRNMSRFLRWGNELAMPFLMLLRKLPPQGAYPVIYCATDPILREAMVSGQYFVNSVPQQFNRYARDTLACRKLWSASEAMVGLDSKKRK